MLSRALLPDTCASSAPQADPLLLPTVFTPEAQTPPQRPSLQGCPHSPACVLTPGQGGKFSGDLLHITVTVVFVVQKNEDMLVAIAGFQSGKWRPLPQHRSVSYLFTHLEFILYLVVLGGLGGFWVFFFFLLLIGFLSDF